ncbi:MAG: hypothetical protein AB1640_17240 [bacterium]
MERIAVSRHRRPGRPAACWVLFLLLAALCCPARTAFGESPKSGSPDKASTGAKEAQDTEDKQPQRSIRMHEVEILGEVEKPKAMFVIPMTPIQYKRGSREKDFTADILAPIDRQWIEEMETRPEAASEP